MLDTSGIVLAFKKKGVNLKNIVVEKDFVTVSLSIKARPGSKVEKVVVSPDGEIVLSFRAKAIDGKANEEIVNVLAKLFGLAKGHCLLSKGEKSRTKRIDLIFNLAGKSGRKNEDYFCEKIMRSL